MDRHMDVMPGCVEHANFCWQKRYTYRRKKLIQLKIEILLMQQLQVNQGRNYSISFLFYPSIYTICFPFSLCIPY